MKKEGKKQSVFDKYAIARNSLLLMWVLTVVNVVVLATGCVDMFLFSASVPYFAIFLGLIEELLMKQAIMITVAVLAAYLLCWIFSKKHFGWMIAALVLFILDIVAMVRWWMFAPKLFGVMDLLIHGWVLYYLIVGVVSGAKIRALTEEELHEEEQPAFADEVLEKTEIE